MSLHESIHRDLISVRKKILHVRRCSVNGTLERCIDLEHFNHGTFFIRVRFGHSIANVSLITSVTFARRISIEG